MRKTKFHQIKVQKKFLSRNNEKIQEKKSVEQKKIIKSK